EPLPQREPRRLRRGCRFPFQTVEDHRALVEDIHDRIVHPARARIEAAVPRAHKALPVLLYIQRAAERAYFKAHRCAPPDDKRGSGWSGWGTGHGFSL